MVRPFTEDELEAVLTEATALVWALSPAQAKRLRAGAGSASVMVPARHVAAILAIVDAEQAGERPRVRID